MELFIVTMGILMVIGNGVVTHYQFKKLETNIKKALKEHND